MNPKMSPERLMALLERWFLEVESGGQPDAAEFCKDDPDLLAEFQRILQQDEAASETLGGLSRGAHGEVSPVPELEGFRIVSELGRGGMGTVYLARLHSIRLDLVRETVVTEA